MFPLKQRLQFNSDLPTKPGNLSWLCTPAACAGTDLAWGEETLEDDYVPGPNPDIKPIEIMARLPKKARENVPAFNFEPVRFERRILLERNSIQQTPWYGDELDQFNVDDHFAEMTEEERAPYFI